MKYQIDAVRLALVGIFAFMTACAPAAPRSEARPVSGNPNVLTAEEIEKAGSDDGTVYEAIRRLRPLFLQYRGVSGSGDDYGKLLVSVNGGRLELNSVLRSIPARRVTEIRFLSVPDAALQFGTTANSSPVILIKTR